MNLVSTQTRIKTGISPHETKNSMQRCDSYKRKKQQQTDTKSFLQSPKPTEGAINMNSNICHSPLSHARGGQLHRHFTMSHCFRGNFAAPRLFPRAHPFCLRCPSRAARGLLRSRRLLQAGARAGPHSGDGGLHLSLSRHRAPRLAACLAASSCSLSARLPTNPGEGKYINK